MKAWRTAGVIQDKWRRADVRRAVAARLPVAPPTSTALGEGAGQATIMYGLGGPGAEAEPLSELAAWLLEKQQAGVLAEALRAAGAIQYESSAGGRPDCGGGSVSERPAGATGGGVAGGQRVPRGMASGLSPERRGSAAPGQAAGRCAGGGVRAAGAIQYERS